MCFLLNSLFQYPGWAGHCEVRWRQLSKSACGLKPWELNVDCPPPVVSKKCGPWLPNQPRPQRGEVESGWARPQLQLSYRTPLGTSVAMQLSSELGLLNVVPVR